MIRADVSHLFKLIHKISLYKSFKRLKSHVLCQVWYDLSIDLRYSNRQNRHISKAHSIFQPCVFTANNKYLYKSVFAVYGSPSPLWPFYRCSRRTRETENASWRMATHQFFSGTTDSLFHLFILYTRIKVASGLITPDKKKNTRFAMIRALIDVPSENSHTWLECDRRKFDFRLILI